jgi:hypothetical protein
MRVAASNTTDAIFISPSPSRYVLDGPRMKALKGFLEREGRLGHNTHKREVPILGS